jgi:glycosyltransferase involved in cell wall biosynthesis
MEAQSQGVACITTSVSAIPELIGAGTGLLVPPADPKMLGEAIRILSLDPDRRADIAMAGQRRVRESFAAQAGLDALAQRFRGC